MRQRRRPALRPMAFYKAYLQGEAQIAMLPLRGESRRVLSALRAVMDWENWVRVPLREVAGVHGIAWRQFNRGAAELRDNGVILWVDHPTDGRCLRVALWVGWRGRDARHGRALQHQAQAEILTLFPLAVEA